MFFRKKNISDAPPPRAPENTRVYAIGDIHGRLDLLKKLYEKILIDSAPAPAGTRKVVIFVGDYVDRGLHSKEVIDFLIDPNHFKGFELVFIKGNHEHAMLNFMRDPAAAEIWLAWGGDATVMSYGCGLFNADGKRMELGLLAEKLRASIPNAHMEFFNNLKIYHLEGDYLFVHAGVRPGVPLEQQKDEDMMIIRDEFIYNESAPIDKTVIFGHTIFEDTFHVPGRIGIDSGAYATGKLTAIVLEGESKRFLYT